VIDLVLPVAILLAGSLLVYVVARLTRSKALTGTTALLIVLVAGYTMLTLGVQGQKAQAASLSAPLSLLATFDLNPLAMFLAIVSLGLTAVVALYSIGYMQQHNIGKYYALLLMMTGGMVGIALSADLFNLFVMFEIMSLASFALVAFEDEWEPVEAGVKYLILSAMGSMIALFGIVLVFTWTGELSLAALKSSGAMPADLALVVAAMFVAGFGVKAAIVPMHTWLPDAHSAAPSGISAMLSGIVISAGLITLLKALGVMPGALIGVVLPLLAILTMFGGNLMAWVQTDLKRMLAYSSIAHMGYILAGVGIAFAAPEFTAVDGMRGGLLHIMNHAIMKGGAFLCAGAIIMLVGTRDIKQMAGIGRRVPLLGISFGIFVLALAGTPPFNGFISKLFICKAALGWDEWGSAIVLIVILNSFLSLFYYLPALNKVLLAPQPSEQVRSAATEIPNVMVLAIFILAVLTLVFGVQPQLGLDLVDPAARFASTLVQ
jgi:proton-translocating NADH-quinone oxidoreductase chain N